MLHEYHPISPLDGMKDPALSRLHFEKNPAGGARP